MSHGLPSDGFDFQVIGWITSVHNKYNIRSENMESVNVEKYIWMSFKFLEIPQQ